MSREIVLVSRELRPLLDGESPEWPGGARTRWVAPSEELPLSERVVALIPLLSREISGTEMDRLDGEVGSDLNFELAVKAFRRTSEYDAAISGWLGGRGT